MVDDFSGGAGNIVQILANEFLHKGNEVTVLLLNYHTSNNRLDKEVNVIKKTITSQNASNKIIWLIQLIQELKELIVRINPDIVISFLDNNNTLIGLSLMFKHIPLIVSERSNPVVIKPKLFWRLLRIPAYLRANAVIVQCSNFVNFNRLFSKKTYVIPNPIIKPQINKDSISNKGEFIIVSVGRLAKIKQFDLMIEVFDQIRTKFPKAELYIYGEGMERNHLEGMIKQLSLGNKVFLPGSTDNVYEALNNSDIYLMTSKQEGFPNALCEAMATGVPVVAFECHEGLRDIVKNGENGFLVPPDDVNTMVEHIEILIQNDDLRYTFSRNARQITGKFNVLNTVNMWEEMINRAMVGK